MKKLFRRLIRIGIYDDTPSDLVDEIKVINSIKVQGAIMVLLSGMATIWIMPEHWLFLVCFMLIHMVVALSVISLNGMRHAHIARWVFVLDPAILVIALTAYFGIATNFHYIILICFLMFIYLFRRRDSQEQLMLLVFILVSFASIALIYVADFQVANLQERQVASIRLVVYVLSAALTIMMGVVLQRSVRTRTARTEQSLKVSERDANILQTISDNMDEAVFKSSLLHGLEYVNEAFVRMYGYDSKEDVLNSHPVNLYQSKAERDALLGRIEKSGKVSNVLMHYRRKDGTSFWGRLSSSKVIEDDEVYLVGTIADVTLQQQQTQLLEESERQLKESQRLAKLGNWKLYPNQREAAWSSECAHILGFLPSDFHDPVNAWIERLEGATEESLRESIERSRMMNEAYEFGAWYTTPSGERKFLYHICQQVVKAGRLIWFGTTQDRTELKNQEEELITTREFYQNVLDKIPVESVLIDDKGKYFYISKNAIGDDEARAFMIGKSNLDYAELRGLSKEFALNRDEKIAEALRGDLTVRWEEKMKTKDGRDTYHIRNVIPVTLIQDGVERKYLIGYSFDINDIKRAQFRLEDRNKELNQLNKELDRFVYSISHDLRAPIASVLGLNALAEEAEEQDELDQILRMQREALDRLDRYIRDVIDYSRNKRLDVRAEQVMVKKTVEECFSDLLYMSNFEEIQFFNEVDENLEWFTDTLRFKIILNNLLSNAIKYADPAKTKPFIAVRAEVKDGRILIEVEDNGIGIKDEFKDQIWDIFFRGTSTIPGSGLGLYILRESVKNLNGEVSYESTESVGTTFRVALPELSQDD